MVSVSLESRRRVGGPRSSGRSPSSLLSTPRPRSPRRSLSIQRRRHSLRSQTAASMLPGLPDVVTNRILQTYLTPDDLRSAHQVSTTWRNMINSRPLVNQKRLARVDAIRNDKENVLPHRGSRSRPASRTSSTDSLQTLNLRTYRLRSCKPFKEIHENSICDDNNNNSSRSSSTMMTPSPSVVTRSMSRKQSLNGTSSPSSPDSKSNSPSSITSPSKLSAKLLSSLGSVKRKGAASLRRIANL